ncbi:MAG: CBS domain-containing protein [Mycobacterium sp.]
MSKPAAATPRDLSASAPLIHLSQLLRAPVVTPSGEAVGRVDDVIVRLRGADTYPLVTGIVAGVGGWRVFVGNGSIQRFDPYRVILAHHEVDLRRFGRRDGEVLLRSDVLGYRLIDVPAGELVRAFEVELENTGDGWVLARLDTRRPPRLFGLLKAPGGHAARDWKAFEPLIGHGQSMAVRRVSGRVGALKPAQIADLLSRMRADDAADAVIDLRQFRRRRVLELMPAPQRTKVITLLGFNPDSAGGLMNVDIVSCGAGATAGEALAVIGCAQAVQPESLLQIHVLNEHGQLAGVVSVIALLQTHPADAVARLMDSEPIRLAPDADLADVAVLMADYDLHTISVVDDQDQVLGVVTVDDVLKATIPDDWRRREPGPRPVREPTELCASDDPASIGGEGGEWP